MIRQYVKIIDTTFFFEECMFVAYIPIEGKDFQAELTTTLTKIYTEFPYHESELDEPCMSDVIWAMQDAGWDILESDYEGYDKSQEKFAEVIYVPGKVD